MSHSHHHSYPPTPHHHHNYPCEELRLEGVVTCVGFDDILDHTLPLNHGQFDHLIVVSSHDDWKTKLVAQKHGATFVPTDLFAKQGRAFNKGAAINAGMAYFRYNGWRAHLDADIAAPDSFRRVLFNRTHLEKDCIYGVDRVDVIGDEDISHLRDVRHNLPQYQYQFLVDPTHQRKVNAPIGGRFVSDLDGYVPIGYFQMWNAAKQRPYPFSLGTAEHDDVMFARLWPESKRRLIPTLFVYHFCSKPPSLGEHWDGKARSTRLRS